MLAEVNPNKRVKMSDEDRARMWLSRKQNENTNKTYESALRQYQTWLANNGKSIQGTTEADVVLYLTSHVGRTKGGRS